MAGRYIHYAEIIYMYVRMYVHFVHILNIFIHIVKQEHLQFNTNSFFVNSCKILNTRQEFKYFLSILLNFDAINFEMLVLLSKEKHKKNAQFIRIIAFYIN